MMSDHPPESDEARRVEVRPDGIWAPSLYQVGLAVLLGGIFAASMSPYLNTDLWWHLRVGEMIVTEGRVPDRDTLSFTATGQPWLVHEWLAEVIFYLMHRSFGIPGLLVLVSSVVTLTFLLLHIRMLRRGASPILSLALMIPAWIAAMYSFFLRIQPITLLLLAAFLLLLEEFQRTRRRRLLIAMPVLMLVWANLHGGFAVGLVVILIYLVGEVLESLREDASAMPRRDLLALALCLVASTIASLGTPGGFANLAYPFRFITPNFFTDHINESQRPAFADPIAIAFEILLLGLLAAAFLRRERVRWPDILVVVSFAHLGLSQLRHLSVFSVAAAPLLAHFGSDVLGDRFRGSDALMRRPSGRLLPVFHWVVLLGSFLLLGTIAQPYLTNETLRFIERRDYPSAASEFLVRGDFGTKVFAEYRWGGYVLWKLNPTFQTFIDGRADTVFSEENFAAYLDIYSLAPGWEQKLDRSGTDIVLLEPESRLASALTESAFWRPVYRDEVAVAFVRRGS